MKKKILILGGTTISKQIFFAAKEMGLDVYVTDYNSDSPCKVLADKNFMVSATDINGVVDLIQKERIDGVLMGYADVLLPFYVKICQVAGLPCYANEKSIRITTDKYLFKKCCEEHNIPVVPEYTYEEVLQGKTIFPLIVKPVDNSGARGIFICHDISEFKEKYAESITFSRSKRVIIEPLIQSEEATIFYYLHEGKAYLLGIGDRWMYEQNNNTLKLPVGYTFPSIGISKFISEEDNNIKNMFNDLGMNEGMVFIQTFRKDDDYIVYEMGYRLTGSLEHHLMEAQYGFNHLKAMIDYAVGNKVDTSSLKKINPLECCMANVSLLLKEGKISSYSGLDETMNINGVRAIHVSHSVGTVVDDKIIGKLAQLGVRILLTAHEKEELLQKMDKVKEGIHAFGEDGEEMIIKNYSYQKICQ